MNKNEKFVITINREVGSGGRTVGRKLAEKLGVKYCDKAVIDGLTHQFGLSPERIEEIKAQKKSWWNDVNIYYQTLVNSASKPMEADVKLDNATMFETEKRILQKLAKESSCVVAGRTGFMVFREWPNHLSVFIQASMEHRIKRVMNRQNVTLEEARNIIAKMKTVQRRFYKNCL
jgi:cytidylate kinase